MGKSIVPVKTAERISSIDILRGFALLGIVLVNSLGFNASFFDFGGFYSNLSNDFQKTFYTIYISLTADKFIFLFSFLFGYGMFLQFKKFNHSKKSFSQFFSRRMLVLFFFGIAHVLFLWAGDILILYSITGLLMLIVCKLPTKWQIALAIFFYFFIGIWLSFSVWIHLPNALSSTYTEGLQKAKLIYAHGNYFDCLNLRLQEYFAFRNINVFYYLPKIIGLTILGFIAAKFNFHKKLAANKLKWFLVLIFFATIGIALYFGFGKIVDPQSRFAMAISMTGYELTNLFIAMSYLLMILLLSSFFSISKFLRPFALMGRMSLTNYISQSIIFSIIFYSWGFGLFGQSKVTIVVLIAIVVYVFQVILNLIWFKFYQQGPLEKLWRKWSYKDY
ncbi:MAG: DUF418 domain-containing protein [Bacteroidetes bacterium]|nr:DUF418 domain-containing protein [Bacteroidota bacterium]